MFGSAGLRVGAVGTVCTYNYHTNMGLIQHDGSSIQAGVSQYRVFMSHNWVLDTHKLALRIDSGEDGVFGLNGTMYKNVIQAALGGAQIKGFGHRIVGNTAHDCVNQDINIMRRTYLSEI